MRLRLGHTIIFILLGSTTFSQDDSTKKISVSGYGELYWSFDFSRPADHEKISFLYNYKRHNEINLNLAYVKLTYQEKKIRANFSLMTGNYAQYNLATEPEVNRFIS